MNRIFYLWPESEEDFRPSIKEFKVEGSRGAVVVCPGGGYTMKAPHEADPIAEMINEAGVSAYVLDYHVIPCDYLAPLADAHRAIRLVRSMGYEKVGILGFSAGGHLSSTAATLYTPGDPEASDPLERLSSRPDAFIPCYGVSNVCDHLKCGTRRKLLGMFPDDSEELRRLSADYNVTEDTPPAFIWHTFDDAVVPVEHSLHLARALSEKGVSCEMHLFPHGPHGLGLAQDSPDVAQWVPLCQNWLIRQGFAQSTCTEKNLNN